MQQEELANSDLANLIGSDFPSSVRWAIMEPDTTTKLKGELKVDEKKFRAPITLREEFEKYRDKRGGIPKYNLLFGRFEREDFILVTEQTKKRYFWKSYER